MCLWFSLSATAQAQTTYYVAATGNDANDGRSPNTPLLSINRVNSLALQPGDKVLFRRGDTFRGSLTIRQSGTATSPILIDAFGTGTKPVLAGSVVVSGWTSLGNNIWQATCADCSSRVTGLYRNGAALPLGRYPNSGDANKGYLTVQSHSGKTQLTAQQGLPANFTGGEAVVRPVQWILDRTAITAQSGNSLSLSNPSNYDLSDGWGFFIQNHPATLDQGGEWYYNPATKTLRLYDGGDPNGSLTTATAFGEGVNLGSSSGITVRNVVISQTLSTGLLASGGSNLVVSGCAITQSGEDGLVVNGNGSDVLVENSLIEDANNNGVAVGSYQNVTFRGNTLRRIGVVAGRGKSGDGTYSALQFNTAANALIENNVIDNIGYNGISYTSGTTIQKNVVSNYCLTKSDGGGIYTWNGNKNQSGAIRVLSNIVFNGLGAPEGTAGGAYSGANGIYFDDCAQNIEATGNTVFNCRGLGIFLHATSNLSLTGNTSYNNGESQLALTHNHGGCLPRTNSILNNVLVSKQTNQWVTKYESNTTDLSQYGTFDNNYYVRPFDESSKILAVQTVNNNVVGYTLGLAQWQSQFGQDAHSQNSPLTYSGVNPDDVFNFQYNATDQNATVTLNGTYRDVKNKQYSGSVTLAPFSSLVLLKETGATPAPVTPTLSAAPLGTGIFLSDLPWVSATGGYGPIERDQSTGDSGGGDGHTITLNNVTYAKGLGAHANSEIVYALGGKYASFTTDMGVDDEVTTPDCGSVEFKIYVDDVLLYSSGVMTATTATKTITLDVTGKQTLKLVLTNGGDNINCDHGDWAGARLTLAPVPATPVTTPAPVVTTPAPVTTPVVTPVTTPAPVTPPAAAAAIYLSDLAWASATGGYGPVERDLSNGDNGAGDGHTLTLNGVTYAKGLGAHAYSEIVYVLGGKYASFTTDMGVDDEMSNNYCGSVEFKIYLDNALVYSSGVMTPASDTKTITLDVTSKQTLKLVVTDGGDNLNCDHGDWAGARLTLASATTPVATPAPVVTTPAPVTVPIVTTPAPVTPPVAVAAIYLSDLNWTSMTNAFGPVEKDRSNGDSGNNDGRTITLNGVTYAKGLGAHASSELIYNLGGQYSSFTTDMGLDDEMNDPYCGSVEFKIYLDGVLAYSSGVMRSNTVTKSVTLDVTGKQTLKLVLGDGGDNYNCDHGDWAGARLTPASGTVAPTPVTTPVVVTPTATGAAIYLSDLNWVSMTNAFGPVEKDRSNGDSGNNDGRTITLNGVTYAKGLGAHASSELVYNLGGQYSSFTTDMGLDDEMNDPYCGSVEFKIYLDGVLAYSSGVMRSNTATKSVTLSVSGKQTLRLVLSDGGDNYNCDHGDWAGARLIPTGSGRVGALGADERSPEVSVQVYPVPARDELQIRYPATAEGSLSLQLVNLIGEPVLQTVQAITEGENLIRLPVRDQNRGAYILILSEGNRRITRKVLLTE